MVCPTNRVFKLMYLLSCYFSWLGNLLSVESQRIRKWKLRLSLKCLLSPQRDCDLVLSTLGGTGQSKMETVITMCRFQMTHALLFLTAVFISNLWKQRWEEMWLCMWMRWVWPELPAKERRFQVLGAVQLLLLLPQLTSGTGREFLSCPLPSVSMPKQADMYTDKCIAKDFGGGDVCRGVGGNKIWGQWY